MVTKHRVAVNKDMMLYPAESYKTLLTTYLRNDPTPITLSIKQNLAKKMQTMSPAGVGNYIRALKSPFGFLREEGLFFYTTPPRKAPRLGTCALSDKEVIKDARPQNNCHSSKPSSL